MSNLTMTNQNDPSNDPSQSKPRVHPAVPAKQKTDKPDAISELRIFLEIAYHQKNRNTIGYGPFQWDMVRSLEAKGLVIIHQYIKNSTDMVPEITEKGTVYLQSLLDTPMPVAKTTWTKG